MGFVEFIGPVLANVTLPDPASSQSISWLAMTLAGLAGSLVAVHELYTRLRGKPTSADVAAEARDKYVALAACATSREESNRRIAAVEAAVIGIREELSRDRVEVMRASEERASGLHERINDVLAAVSELKGRLKL